MRSRKKSEAEQERRALERFVLFLAGRFVGGCVVGGCRFGSAEGLHDVGVPGVGWGKQIGE